MKICCLSAAIIKCLCMDQIRIFLLSTPGPNLVFAGNVVNHLQSIYRRNSQFAHPYSLHSIACSTLNPLFNSRRLHSSKKSRDKPSRQLSFSRFSQFQRGRRCCHPMIRIVRKLHADFFFSTYSYSSTTLVCLPSKLSMYCFDSS